MPLSDLTDDEKLMQAYCLTAYESTWHGHLQEVRYILPAAIFAGCSLYYRNVGMLWVAFLWLLGCYSWRVGSVRWMRAVSSLVRKYHSELSRLEAAESADRDA